MCVCERERVFIKLHISAQSGPVILVILRYSHLPPPVGNMCVCLSFCLCFNSVGSSQGRSGDQSKVTILLYLSSIVGEGGGGGTKLTIFLYSSSTIAIKGFINQGGGMGAGGGTSVAAATTREKTIRADLLYSTVVNFITESRGRGFV